MAVLEDAPLAAAAPRASGRRWADTCLGQTLVALVLLDLCVLLRTWWAAQAVALGILLLLPGFLLLRSLRFTELQMVRSAGWLVSASLVTLTTTGLVVDGVGPLVGVDRPLDTTSLAVAVNAACLGLALLPGTSAPVPALERLLRAVDRRALASLVVPAAAAVGALRLNTDRGSSVAVAAAVGIVALVGIGVVGARRWTSQRSAWILFSASAGLLLSYGLRSSYVFGWDISAELALVERTIAEGYWAAAHPGDAYGAMLSLTVLPAVLVSVAGVAPLALLKLVVPLLFALVPVATFGILRRTLPSRAAFIGAALLLTLPSFASEMPALARQEIALLFFVSLLAAISDRALPRIGGPVLLVLLTAGVVVAHYSTTYTLVTVLAGAVLVRAVVGRWHRSPLVDRSTLVALVTAAVLGFGWYQMVTISTQHVAATVSQLLESGLHILPADSGESPLQAYLRGPKPATPATVEDYQDGIAEEFAVDRPWVVTSPESGERRWTLAAPAPVHSTRPSPLFAVVDLASLAFSQMLVLLTVLGTLTLLVRRRTRGRLLDAAILALPAIGLLGVIRVSANLAASYGQGRLYIQLLPIVAVPVLWGMAAAYRTVDGALASVWKRWTGRPRRAARTLAVAAIGAYLMLLVAISTGLPRAVGGDRSAPNLFNGGEHYTRFYVTAPEVAAAQWLGQVQPEGSLTYSDVYGQLRIYGYGIPKGVILTDVTPRTLDVNAWVYGSRANVVEGQGRANFDDQQILYVWPEAFLTDQLGIVYSNGTSEVYRR